MAFLVTEVDVSVIITDEAGNTGTATGLPANLALDGTARAIMAMNKEPITLLDNDGLIADVIGGDMRGLLLASISITLDDAETRDYCEDISLCY